MKEIIKYIIMFLIFYLNVVVNNVLFKFNFFVGLLITSLSLGVWLIYFTKYYEEA